MCDLCATYRKVLGAEKAPYVATLAAAGLAWTITRVVSLSEATPLLEYRQIESGFGGTPLAYEVTNLSRHRFSGLQFFLEAERGSKVTLSDPTLYFPPPAMQNPLFKEAARMVDAASPTAQYTIYELQPGWRVELRARMMGPPDRVHLRHYTKDLPAEGVQPFRLEKESWLGTDFVEHQRGILLGVAVLWLLLLGGSLFSAP